MKNKEKKKWSKTKKIVLSILGIFVVGLSIFAGVTFGYVDGSLSAPLKVDVSYSTWMSKLKDDAHLLDVVIPGSHDAGCNKMLPQAMTQGHDIKDQLNGGVRYFDTRVTKSGDDLKIFHGPISGQSFYKVLDEFNDFIKANPSEFIIIDMQHLGKDANKDVIKAINENLPLEHMLKVNEFPVLKDVTFKDLRDNKLNFMVTWKSDSETLKHEALENRYYPRSDYLQSDYDGAKHKESDEALLNQFNTYYDAKEEGKLFVLQAQRTAKTLLGKPSEYEKGFADKCTDYIKTLKNDPVKLAKTNIIMRDFIVSDIKKVNTILELNLSKGLIEK